MACRDHPADAGCLRGEHPSSTALENVQTPVTRLTPGA
jgi:hypothetical protein